jgi:hypothetical protein
MMHELSLAELESELSAELPTRTLLRRKRVSAKASAHHGSAAAGNATYQVNFNPQVVINNGTIGGPVNVSSFNRNFNTTQQQLQPVNILAGLGL